MQAFDLRVKIVALACITILGSQASIISSVPSHHDTAIPFSPGFSVQNVLALAENISSHSWEYGTATEALLELFNPDLAVFGDSPFEESKRLEAASTSALPRGLAYAESKIVIGTGPNALSDGDGAVGDPASLGVGAALLGKRPGLKQFADAAKATVDYVTQGAPRATNGAISHRVNIVELWADFVYMAPPFLAYYAADTSNATLLREAVRQCQAYREVLQLTASSAPGSSLVGLWHHISGPQNNDPGLWSTGNSWAAAGMARVLATVLKAPFLQNNRHEDTVWRHDAIDGLTTWIKEIVDAAIGAGDASYEGGLIKNYYDNPEIFGETSGSSLLAATVYRMVILRPDVFGRGAARQKYLRFAEGIRKTLGGTFFDPISGTKLDHVDAVNGTVRPSVNPLGWGDTAPWMTGSPEGQSFVVLLYSAWRDCVLAHVCERD